MPFLSCPISAKTLDDVDAGRDTNVNSGVLADHSIVAALRTKSPSISPAALTTCWRGALPAQWTANDAVVGTDGPPNSELLKVPKSSTVTLRTRISARPLLKST